MSSTKNLQSTTIEDLNLKSTYSKYITRMGISNLEELFNRTPKEIEKTRGVGKKTLGIITGAMNDWAEENNVDITHTPYHTQISNQTQPLIHLFPPTQEGQFDHTIQDLWLDKQTKDLLLTKSIQQINDLLLYKEDELLHTLHLSEETIQNIITAVNHFRNGVIQPKRLGTLYPFESSSQYNKSISSIGISEFTIDALNKAGIHTLGDLSQYTPQDLLSIEGIGQARIDEIEKYYQNYKYDLTYIHPSDTTLPQTIKDSANRFTFDTRTERGLSKLQGYRNGKLTVEDLLNTSPNTLSKIRNFGKASTSRVVQTLSEWLSLHNIRPEPFILLKAFIPPTSVADQLYRLEFTDRVLKHLNKWNNNQQVQIIELLNTPITTFLNDLDTTPSVAGKIVETLYIWCKEQNINPVGYKLFEKDYLHRGVEKYLRHNAVTIGGKNIQRQPTVTRIKTPTDKGLFSEILLVVRYNNHTYRISEGNELVKGYPIHFKLLEKLD